VEPREDRKRKNTDRGLDGDSSDEEQEIEEEPVPPFQHQPGQGMHYGLLETRLPNVPSYVSRVDYRGKGMTRKARDERRVYPRGLPKVQYDHCFQTAFHMDFYSSVILTKNLVVAKSHRVVKGLS
jgi:guanyl-specific ribonuclease Sa